MDLKFLELDHNDSEQFQLTRHNSQLLLDEKNHVVEVEATQITDQENNTGSFRYAGNNGVAFTNSTASADQINRNIMAPIEETLVFTKDHKRKHMRKYEENKASKKCSVGCRPKRFSEVPVPIKPQKKKVSKNHKSSIITQDAKSNVTATTSPKISTNFSSKQHKQSSSNYSQQQQRMLMDPDEDPRLSEISISNNTNVVARVASTQHRNNKNNKDA